MKHVIMMSNLGYLRGINGGLAEHMRYAYRHVYCPPGVQQACIRQVTDIIRQEQPDICCFVEIEKDAHVLHKFNQLESLISEEYPFFDIENKYGPLSRLRSFPLTRGKSNGFIARREFAYEKIFFTHGSKRLIYKIALAPDISLFFAHFSLKKSVRARQLLEIRELAKATPGESILLGDFNVHSGFGELALLMHDTDLVLLNKEEQPTFRFHTMQLPLDLCICTPRIAAMADLRIIPQPYSDHDALVLTLNSDHGKGA